MLTFTVFIETFHDLFIFHFSDKFHDLKKKKTYLYNLFKTNLLTFHNFFVVADTFHDVFIF